MTDLVTSADAVVRADWAARAESWNKTAPESLSTADQNNQRMIAAAGIEPGMAVLDLASGTGEPAITIARHVGPTGSVVATDGVRGMLRGAERRASKLALANMSFVVADMVHLPFADATFDAVTCRFGIMFPLNAVGAATEARRVLKPGCKAAYMVHGPYEDDTQYKTVREATLTFFGREIPKRPLQRHRFGDSGAIARVMTAAGFADVEEVEFKGIRETPADQPFWRTTLERSFSKDYYAMGEDERNALDQAIEAAFEPHVKDGVFQLQTHARLGVGTAG